ncbi:MAG: condensin complex protein MksE [Bacteroidota bacterium]
MDYPKSHKQVVKELLDGKFILPSEPLYQVIRENGEFYTEFFKMSFDYELRMTNDFCFLLSGESNETLSRDICIFFAILSYELDRDGRNFIEEIQYSEWDQERVDKYFENSNYTDLINSNKQLRDKDSRKTFVNSLGRRNIIDKHAEDKFTFTLAYKVFIDFASELARNKIKEGVN